MEYKNAKPIQFKFKEDDKRAITLAILESAEYLRKSKELEEKEPVIQKSFFDVYTTDMEDFKTPNAIQYYTKGMKQNE